MRWGAYTAFRPMPRTLPRLGLGVAVGAALVWSVAVPAVASPGLNNALTGTPVRSVYVRAARGTPATLGKPVQVLMALHGMHGNGEDFSRELIEQADHY